MRGNPMRDSHDAVEATDSLYVVTNPLGFEVEYPTPNFVASPRARAVRAVHRLRVMRGFEPVGSWRDMLPLVVLPRERVTGPILDGGVSGSMGIDLAKRGVEVRKLFFASGMQRSILAAGLDPEDFLQELYRAILARNMGTCPWDQKKSSFAHYVHLVMGCVLSNFLRKGNRINSMEGVSEDGTLYGESGIGASPDDENSSHGTPKRMEASLSLGGGSEEFELRETIRDFVTAEELPKALQLVRLLSEGVTRRDAQAQCGLSASACENLLKKIRSGYQF